MLKDRFTEEEMARLQQLSCVEKVTTKMIVFTREFKFKAIEQRASGASIIDVFEDAGIDTGLFPRKHFMFMLKAWRKEIKLRKDEAFIKVKRGRPVGKREEKAIKDMSTAELQAKIAYLEAENDFIKKLKALENISLSEEDMR